MEKWKPKEGDKIIITKGSMEGKPGKVLSACREGYFVQHAAGTTMYQRDELKSQDETPVRNNPGQVS